eukprot:Sspe_Gene.109540::Locus_89679_Transcript_1_1_Confidence_1.000_Length_1126::g.109540::m.109540
MGCCFSSGGDDDDEEVKQQIHDRLQHGKVSTYSATEDAPSTTKPPKGKEAVYTKVKPVGKGAFGVVWKAVDSRTKEVVAIKVVNKDRLDLEPGGGRDRLAREVAIMAALRHSSLVNLHDCFANRSANEMWIVVEFVDGENLMEVINRDTVISEENARKYMQQLTVGLGYVHSQNVAHRDLKPDNVLVSKGGVVKITDFGLSNIQHTDENGGVVQGMSLKTCCGTPYYVAPEVIQATARRGYSGFKCDIWSLGIIHYVMLTGTLPFVGRDLRALLDNIRQGRYSVPPSVSPMAKSLLAIILVPASRRASLDEIAKHPWMQLGGLPEYGNTPDPKAIEDKAQRIKEEIESLR